MALPQVNELIDQITNINNIQSKPNVHPNSNQSSKQHVKYRIELLQKQHVQEALDIVSDAFLTRKEPICIGADIDIPSVWKPYPEYFIMHSLKTGYSNVAIEMNTNKVIGVVIAADEMNELPESVVKSLYKLNDEYHGNWRLIFKFFDDLNLDFVEKMKLQNEWQQGVMLHLCLSAVHKDYRRKGVVTALKKNLIQIARNNGFRYIVSEATNTFSQNQNLKIGFKIMKENTIYYETWEYPQNSGIYPIKSVVKQTGFNKACIMVYNVT